MDPPLTIEILRDSPLLLLFVVAGIGYPLGRLRPGRTSLGVAAVLFVAALERKGLRTTSSSS